MPGRNLNSNGHTAPRQGQYQRLGQAQSRNALGKLSTGIDTVAEQKLILGHDGLLADH